MRRRYLITYDISDDKTRTSIFNLLLDCGDHVQYSVFICELNDLEYTRLIGKIKGIINMSEDQILLLDMGLADRNTDYYAGMETVGIIYKPPTRTMIV